MDLEEFLKFVSVYDDRQKNCIQQEFKRLKDNSYLDHIGATLYSERQLKEIFEDFSRNIYANPHSKSVPSKSTEDAVDIIRYQILEHFHTTHEDYSVIFTSSATAALKIVAECFFHEENKNGTLAHLEDNHTSVLGMRNNTSNSIEIKTKTAFELLTNPKPYYPEKTSNSLGLFVYPAQCNFSGTKYPLDWIKLVQENVLNNFAVTKCKQWYVVLDCACYISTNQLDLSLYKPDFVPISFYKLFGYPTGLGALLVRKASEGTLRKKYFGGGTVQMALSCRNVMIPRVSLHERFEDGTLPFLSILAVKHGFNTIKRLNLNFNLISKHTFSLAQFVYRNLVTLHHSNGQPVVVLYHDTIFDEEKYQGGLVNFNLLRPSGEFIGYSEVLHMANLHGIHLRTGCFCNPGACQRFLKLLPVDVYKQYKAGHTCGDQNDLVDGYPTGSVRISFGYMSTIEDAIQFLQMIENCFVEQPVLRKYPKYWEANNQISMYLKHSKPTNERKKCTEPPGSILEIRNNRSLDRKVTVAGDLENIFLYPIKSCGAFSVDNSWKLANTGLKYDREWMIINSAGICVTQKHNKKLSLVKPYINLDMKTMKLEFKGQPDIEIQLDNFSKENAGYLCRSKICGDKVEGWDCGDDVADWLVRCLDTPGLRLLRQYNCNTVLKDSVDRQLSFANKGQYLLINSATVEWLVDRIDESFSESLISIAQRFRPNFIVSLDQPFEEEEIDEIAIGEVNFENSGKCTRCQMVCINQETGKATKEPLLTLSKELKGKISFGIYLSHKGNVEECTLSIKNKLIKK